MFIPELNDVVLDDIRRERLSQEQLKAAGKFKHTLSDPEMEDIDRLAALMEEVGEAATAMLEQRRNATPQDPNKPGNLRKELIQVAAVACGWIEAIDMKADEEAQTR